MENTTLAVLLFILYFSFLCWLVTPPHPHAKTSSPPYASPSPTPTRPHSFTPNAFPTLDDYRIAFATEPSDKGDAPLSLETIDINTLQLRPARKIAAQLGIKQKVGGKDQPLAWLRAQIGKKLVEQPQHVAPVIQEIINAA